MYGVIGEDDSDVAVLCVLIRRLLNNSSLPIRKKGYDGCGEMLRKAARQLRDFAEAGCRRFIISYDVDRSTPDERREAVRTKIIIPSGLDLPYLALTPQEEIEAFVLADLQAVTRIIPSWQPDSIPNPEAIPSPKEYLTKLSRDSRRKPRYDYVSDNPRVAVHLNLDLVRAKCRQFRPLVTFVVPERGISLPEHPFPGSAAGRKVWAYTNPAGASNYAAEVAAAPDWGAFIRYVQEQTVDVPELRRLCELGSADLAALEDELPAVLATRKLKRQCAGPLWRCRRSSPTAETPSGLRWTTARDNAHLPLKPHPCAASTTPSAGAIPPSARPGPDRASQCLPPRSSRTDRF